MIQDGISFIAHNKKYTLEDIMEKDHVFLHDPSPITKAYLMPQASFVY